MSLLASKLKLDFNLCVRIDSAFNDKYFEVLSSSNEGATAKAELDPVSRAQGGTKVKATMSQ